MADVSVRLEDVDEDNWMSVVLLTTETERQPKVVEQYVASNALSIVQAVYEQTWDYKAVYCGDKPVGFVMYGYNGERDAYEILRLMIDSRYQDKGIGTIALKLAIGELAENEDCDCIYVSTNKDNYGAKRIYEKNGFVYTGEMSGDEELYSLDLSC